MTDDLIERLKKHSAILYGMACADFAEINPESGEAFDADGRCIVEATIAMNEAADALTQLREKIDRLPVDWDTEIDAYARANDALRAEVERLSTSGGSSIPHDIEIERLRAEVERLRSERDLFERSWMNAQAEVERLKVARDGFYDDTVELRKQLIGLRAEHEAELAFEEKAHGQTLAERDAARTELVSLRAEGGDIPTDAFNKWHPEKAMEFPAQAVDVIHYLQDEVERLSEALKVNWAFRDMDAARIAELEANIGLQAKRKLREENASLRAELLEAHAGRGLLLANKARHVAEITALRAEVEQYKAMEAKYYPQDLRAEVQDKQAELWGQQAIIQDKEAELAALRAEAERLQAVIADAAFAPGNATLRAEIERLRNVAMTPDSATAAWIRNAELELLLRHVLCQADENSTINLDAIRAALTPVSEDGKMTPEEMREIFNKAGEAGDPFITAKASTRQLEALVAAEREACARVAEAHAEDKSLHYASGAHGAAAAIRARKS